LRDIATIEPEEAEAVPRRRVPRPLRNRREENPLGRRRIAAGDRRRRQPGRHRIVCCRALAQSCASPYLIIHAGTFHNSVQLPVDLLRRNIFASAN
jgi:hypothetical protein